MLNALNRRWVFLMIIFHLFHEVIYYIIVEDCATFVAETNVYVPVDSNRWTETFRTDINMIWESKDP